MNNIKKLLLIFLPVEILFLIIGISALINYLSADLIKANDYYTQGNEAFMRGNFNSAIENYTQAINIKPKLAPLYYNRARAYFEISETDKALEDCTRAIQRDSKLAEAYGLLGVIYNFNGQYDKAIDNYSRALQLKPSLKENYTNRGNAYCYKGEYDLAIEDYNRRLAIDPREAIVLYDRGNAYAKKEEYDKALQDIDLAIELYPEYRDSYNLRALIFLNSEQYEKAIEEFSELIRMTPGFDLPYLNRGLAYWNLGNYRRAIEDFSQSLIISPDLFSAYFYRGRVYARQGFQDLARADYESSLATAVQYTDVRGLLKAAADLTRHIYKEYPFLNRLGRDRTGDIVRNGLALAIDRTEKLRSVGARGPEFMLEYLNLYYAGVDFEINYGNKEKAFDYSESLRSRGFLDQMGIEAALNLDGLDSNDVQKIRNLIEEIENCQNILNSYAGKTVEGDRRFVDAGTRLENAETQLAALEDLTARRVPRYAELRRPHIVSAAEAVAFCGEERVILEYVLWDSGMDSDMSINSYCLVVGKNGINAVKLDPQFNYTGTINVLRRKIYELDDISSFETERNNLYAALIQPVLHLIPDDVKEILIVPDENLAYLPFDVLRESSTEKDLGESYVISVSPSVSVSAFAARKEERKNEPLIAFGGAWYSRNRQTSARTRDNALANDEAWQQNIAFNNAGAYYSKKFRWLDLPGTEQEVKGLGEMAANSTILLGRDVTEAKVKELSRNGKLSGYPVVHFACHGYFNSDLPVLSGLVMSEVSGRLRSKREDGYLTVPEIAMLNLNANIVILSACDTGRGDVRKGDGMVGLARSLFIAGTRNVGVSLWQISDDVTVEFMHSVYRKVLNEGKSFSTAYFETKKEFRGGKWAHPFYWAAFTIYE